LSFAEDARPSGPPEREAARRIAALLGPAPLPVDDLIRACGLAPQVVQALLVELELDGEVQRHDGNRVALRLR